VTLPEWSHAFAPGELSPTSPLPLPEPAQEWGWSAATGRGVKVAILDSGVDGSHPMVGGLAGSVAFEPDPDDPSAYRAIEGEHADLVGHGTACAGIIRALAPDAEIFSVRVLGANLKGRGGLFLAGIRWALDHDMDILNMSLSSSSEQWFGPLHEVADEAYFRGVLMVCAANNMPGPTYPSQFASVLSVAAREGSDPWSLAYNPRPPVEFGARGIDVEVAWNGGKTIVASGNSFATPHVAGMCALIRSKRPWLTPFQVKSVLQAIADNAAPSSDGGA
jgi:subtilisin